MTWDLITGGTGDIGAHLARHLLRRGNLVRILSRDQSKQLELRASFEAEGFDPCNYRFFIGDVRDLSRLRRAFRDVGTVYHLAALKHVDSCEYNPEETIKTNVGGTGNVISAAIDTGAESVVFASTDKAAEPNNVMGATKLTAEKLITQANSHHPETRFVSIRFGNVLGSRGSVLRLWRNQVCSTGSISVTDPTMTRYVLTLEESSRLLIDASRGVGGEVFVRRMPVARLEDLAKVFCDAYCRRHDLEFVPRRQVGRRPGETQHEKIITSEESERAFMHGDNYVILPPMMFGARDYSRYRDAIPVGGVDSSREEAMSVEALRDMLISNKLI